MFPTVIKILLILLLSRSIKCQRRIVNGEPINKTYVVYIVWDLLHQKINENYDTSTICGGILLNEYCILTAASCLKIVPIQYVIAGYNKYVTGGVGRNEEEKDCLEIAKKPIIEKCYYQGTSSSISEWPFLDISVAKTETPYNFNDVYFKIKCSYQPTKANYQFRKVQPGTDVVLFGWGSSHYHRQANLTIDVNEAFLRGTTTKTTELQYCDDSYSGMVHNKYKTRFCTEGPSILNVHGEPTQIRRTDTNNRTESKPLYAIDVMDMPGNETVVLTKSLRTTRKNGPCQNDHGGPVVTWENGTEIVFGIITGYLVNKNMECVSPALYTLLLDYQKFIHCSIKKLTP